MKHYQLEEILCMSISIYINTFQMTFLLTGLVQFGDETEMVDIYVGSSLSDVHAQLVAPFHLDPNQCIIQIFESKIFNEYINLSKISLLTNMNSGRFRIIFKKVTIFFFLWNESFF